MRTAYGARSKYVPGDVLKEYTETDQLEQLRQLRLTTREVILRWLVLTPTDTSDLAPLLTDAAATGNTASTVCCTTSSPQRHPRSLPPTPSPADDAAPGRRPTRQMTDSPDEPRPTEAQRARLHGPTVESPPKQPSDGLPPPGPLDHRRSPGRRAVLDHLAQHIVHPDDALIPFCRF